jgi:hypothetical protein
VLDIGRLVTVVGKRRRQLGVLRVWLRVIPTYAFLASKDGIAVVKQLAIREIEVFENTQFQAVAKPDSPSNEPGRGAVRYRNEAWTTESQDVFP